MYLYFYNSSIKHASPERPNVVELDLDDTDHSFHPVVGFVNVERMRHYVDNSPTSPRFTNRPYFLCFFLKLLFLENAPSIESLSSISSLMASARSTLSG